MSSVATDFQTVTETALKHFEERVAGFDVDECWEFSMEVARLESQVSQLYALSALSARREPDIDKVAEIWGVMVAVCDVVCGKIQELCENHPLCSASHDRILDIRNKSARLRDLHA